VNKIARKTAVLVLGMHRSGTSAITRMINLLGVDIAEQLEPANPANIPGHWESRDIILLDDSVLESTGSSWHDWRLFEKSWFQSPASRKLKSQALNLLNSDFQQSSAFIIKEPRICRITPFWLDVLDSFNARSVCVLVIRNPLEVADSLFQRDGFSLAKSYMLWLRYVLDAELETRGVDRVVVTYDDLLVDWRSVARKISSELDITWPTSPETAEDEIDQFLQVGYRHHSKSTVDLQHDAGISGWVKKTYSALLSLSKDNFNTEVLTDLDRIRDEFNKACFALGPVVRAEEEAREETEQKIEELESTVVERNWKVSELKSTVTERNMWTSGLQSVVAERNGRISGLESTVDEKNEKVSDLEVAVAERNGRLNELESLLSERQADVWHLQIQRNQLVHKLDGIQGSSAWKLAKPARMLDQWKPGVSRAMIGIPKMVLWTIKFQLKDRLRMRKEAEAILASGLFNPSWYVEQNPEIIIEGWTPLIHWLTAGWREGRNPGPDININAYIEQNPEVLAKGINPLTHYLQNNANGTILTGTGVDSTIKKSDSNKQYDHTGKILPLPAERDTDYQEFVERQKVKHDINLIAFYLPQFHPIQENDEWWGKGFTEWTNVSKATPQFVGHYQPRFPGELGFYDLRLPEVLERQVELARNYGVGGFCFHHYWFNGKRLLERPLELFLANPALDIGFCLNWANENWSRRWDGFDQDILIAQQHSAEDDLNFIRSLEQAFRDPRYIKIDDRLLLMVYRPSLMPDPTATATLWRDYCKKAGLGDLYLVSAQFGDDECRPPEGFDAAVEFPPHIVGWHQTPINNQLTVTNPDHQGTVLAYDDMVAEARRFQEPDYTLIRGVCPGWDNEARRPGRGCVFHGSTPEKYKEWLVSACQYADQHPIHDQKLVFVNAWNEWAEGAYLEPDRRYGYAYLEATYSSLSSWQDERQQSTRRIIMIVHDAHSHGAQQNALHMIRTLRTHFNYSVEIILLGEGPMWPDFEREGRVHNFTSGITGTKVQLDHLKSLHDEGIEAAICNTTVTGSMALMLKESGFRVVSLVHEMSSLLREYGLEKQASAIGEHADVVVFASRIVQESFLQHVKNIKGRSLIHPQGLYKAPVITAEKSNIHKKIRAELKLSEQCKLVLAVGWADLRKGIDIFERVATRVVAEMEDVAFIWLGCEDKSLLHWFGQDNEKLGYKERIQLMPRVENVGDYYMSADLLLLPSREDPFPSVVLEAMSYGLPVVCFDGATGVTDLLERNCGVILPYLNEQAMSQAVIELLENKEKCIELGRQGQEIIKKEFNWVDYIHFLVEQCGEPQYKISVIVPNFDYARHLSKRLKSIFNQTYPIYEVIILDDASKDESVEVLNWLKSRYGYDFKLDVNGKNSGSVFKQWLKGVEMATGDLIWIAEADDFSDRGFLENVAPSFDDPEMVLAYSESRQVDENDQLLAENYLEYVKDIDSEKWTHSWIRGGIEELKDSLVVKNTIPNVSAVLFRSERLLKVLKEEMNFISSFKIAGDWATYYKLLSFGGKISFIHYPLNNHRRHSCGVTFLSYGEGLVKEIIQMQKEISTNIKPTAAASATASQYISHLNNQFGLE